MGNDPLYQHFNAEMKALRGRAIEFAKDYPEVAETLAFSAGRSMDPHVELLMQSFSFLTGRLGERLDYESAQQASHLINLLYPHLLKPVPSMGIAQFDINPSGADFEEGYCLPRGTSISSQAKINDERVIDCHFSTCYDTDLWPLCVESVTTIPLNQREFDPPEDITFRSILKIRVAPIGKDPINQNNINKLRFFINGDGLNNYKIYDCIRAHTKSIMIKGDKDDNPQHLNSSSINWLGFSEEQAVLPASENLHQGFRILQEYFCFAEKFLFFEIESINSGNAEEFLDIYFFIDADIKKDLHLSKNNFLLNCVPFINLFPCKTEPIRFDLSEYEYPLVPDHYNYDYMEIYDVEKVFSVDAQGVKKQFDHFLSNTSSATDGPGSDATRWYTICRHTNRKKIAGTETFLSLSRTDLNANSLAEDSIYAQSVCTNRDLPENMRIGSRLNLEEEGPVNYLVLISKPTRHQTPQLVGEHPWLLISHIHLQQLAISNNDDNLMALKKILSLYSTADNSLDYYQIESIVSVKATPKTIRIHADGWRGFCPGHHIELTLDDKKFVGKSRFLFADVIHRFLALYTSLNTYIELTLKSKQTKDIWKLWQPLAGEQALL